LIILVKNVAVKIEVFAYQNVSVMKIVPSRKRDVNANKVNAELKNVLVFLRWNNAYRLFVKAALIRKEFTINTIIAEILSFLKVKKDILKLVIQILWV
jgi:hypothetical protein